jgi:hypothetical protein
MFLSINIPWGCTLDINDLHILGMPMGSQDFALHFLDETLCQDVVHIDDIFLLRNAQVDLGILSSCVACRLSYFTWTIPPSSSFLSLLAGFKKRVMQVFEDIIGLRLLEYFGVQLLISFGGIHLLSMDDYAPSTFLGNWALVVLYLCSKFCIFNRPILKKKSN